MAGAYSPPDVTSRLPCQRNYEQAQIDCVLCIGWQRVPYTNGEYTMTVRLGLEQRNIITFFRHQTSEATLIDWTQRLRDASRGLTLTHTSEGDIFGGFKCAPIQPFDYPLKIVVHDSLSEALQAMEIIHLDP